MLSFWHGETPALDQLFQQLLLTYQRAHPGIEVQIENHGVNLYQDYRRAVLSGSAPDLILLSENRWIGPLAEQGLLADLSSAVADAETALTPVARATAQHNGATYGLPLTLNVPVLFFNTAVFPGGAPPANTEEWLSVGRSLTGNDQVGLAYNLSLYFTLPYLSAWGGTIFDASEEPVLATSAYTPTLEWLTWVRDLAFDEQLLARDDYRAISQAVQSNRAAMTIDWARNLDQYIALWGPTTGVRPLPMLSQTSQPPVPMVRSSVLAISPRSQAQQQAVALDLMRYLVGPDAQSTLRASGMPSVRRDLEVSDPLQAQIDRAVDGGQPWPTSVRFNTSWDILVNMVRSVINGRPIDDTMRTAEQRLRAQ